MPQCLRCGGTEFDNGKLVTTGTGGIAAVDQLAVVYISSEDRESKNVWIGTMTCLNCGHVELYLNPKQLK